MVNCLPFVESVMNIRGLGTDRLHLKLRILSDEDLWWLFLHHREGIPSLSKKLKPQSISSRRKSALGRVL